MDLFAQDFILIPIYRGLNHCSLPVFGVKRVCIFYYDSLHAKPIIVLDNLCAYLQKEFETKKKIISFWFWLVACHLSLVTNIPFQSNADDCCIYTCLFADLCSKDVTNNMRTKTGVNMNNYQRKILNSNIMQKHLWKIPKLFQNILSIFSIFF